MKSLRLLLPALLLALLVDTTPGGAEPRDPEAFMEDLIVNRLGIPQDSKFYRPLINELHRRARSSKSSAPSDLAPSDTPDETAPDEEEVRPLFPQLNVMSAATQIVKHYRGSKGIDLPTKEVMSKLLTIPDGVREQLEAEIKKQIEAEMNRHFPILSLPRCTASRTEMKDLGGETVEMSKEAQQDVVADYLYLNSNDVPASIPEAFGREVVVYEFENGAEDPVGELIHEYKINCVPFRVTLTGRWIVVREGLDALKNFDKNALGKGKLVKAMDFAKELYK